ncbi:AAA family ATPase [Thalassobaculum sp.]|uniref:Lon protease family protein n=1 Tax=Thalassobaculum sp. TaxID=2022740 RepID=UPI0032ECC916
MAPEPLPASALYRTTDLSALGFRTTKDLADVETLVGQDRALDAVRFAARMRSRGYNVFVIGPKGSGKHAAVHSYLTERAATFPSPDDWVYVNDFDDLHRPRCLRLPSGVGPAFARRVAELVKDLSDTLPSLFEGEDYRLKREAMEKSFAERGESGFKEVADEAAKRGLALVRTPQGLVIAPVENGKPMPQERFAELPQDQRETLATAIEEVQVHLRAALHQAPILERERQIAVRDLDRREASALVDLQIAEARAGLDLPSPVAAWFDRLRDDLISNIARFAHPSGEEAAAGAATEPADRRFRRWEVNVLIAHDPDAGAPVVNEDHPTLGRLIGRIEHRAYMGAMLTDFTLIRPGALHAANGGYLLLDAAKLLNNAFAWDALKRALYAEQVTIEGPMDSAATALAVSIQPCPIPISVKVVLFGDQQVYAALSAMDPDFGDLFKVAADFDDVMDRDPEHDAMYARLVATIQRRAGLRSFDRKAVERVIEHCSRLVSDTRKVTARVGLIADVMREADYVGRDKNHKVIRADDVDDALAAQIYRSDRIERRMREQILRETIRITTEGTAVGQVNGLSVLQIGAHAFGRPTRISARVRVGRGRVIDIEREVELGGPLHSKGMLILQGFLAGTYATDIPVALQASVVFEQSYGGVDGDSASSTELYALLSALSELPIRQGIAVTGSVDQMGRVQAIGGVNEKIEGYFDICNARGLSGEQGVMIPRANVEHLMLKSEVVEACRRGAFRIWPIDTIDEGIEVLTGVAAGERGADGLFPDHSVNRRVEDRLIGFAKARRRFLGDTEEE